MKNTIKAGMFVVATTLLASGGAYAQDGSGSGTDSSRTTTTQTDNRREESPDYSWLGLLGLAGLAGLLKKPERQVVHQTETVRTQNVGTGTNVNR